MEFRDEEDKLCNIFKEEYKLSKFMWRDFVKSLDLGILFDNYSHEPHKRDPYTYVYKVVDEQKWLLTRLKYGI